MSLFKQLRRSKRFSRTIITLAWGASLMAAFGSGIAVGVYYHREISVWQAAWQHLGDAPLPDAPAVIKETTTSVIELPGLIEPLPLVYSETLEEAEIQEYLKRGAVVLPLGTSFGDPGNVVVTAHSSGTQSFGPYRFAFAKLSELVPGDEYTISTPSASYTYRVYGKEIVWPHEVNKLPRDERSTVTLVTCWPLWTNFQRLLVHTELVKVMNKV